MNIISNVKDKKLRFKKILVLIINPINLNYLNIKTILQKI